MGFAVLTILFRVSEKTATPTSVCIMVINSCVGSLWRGAVQNEVSQQSVNFFLDCVPVVVFGAPIGSMLGSHLDRRVLAGFVYATDTIQFVGAVVILRVWEDVRLWGSSLVLFVLAVMLFRKLAGLGVGWEEENPAPTSLNTPKRKEERGEERVENGKGVGGGGGGGGRAMIIMYNLCILIAKIIIVDFEPNR